MTWPSLERNLSISRSAESPQNHGDHLLSRLPWQRSLHGRVWTLNLRTSKGRISSQTFNSYRDPSCKLDNNGGLIIKYYLVGSFFLGVGIWGGWVLLALKSRLSVAA